MNIYFACSITGGRQDEHTFGHLVDVLLGDGHQVPTAHIARSGIEEADAREEPLDIYQRDVDWITESDLLVAEVSTPSHGVGYEIGYALALEKPVLCLYKTGTTVSKMITGNPDPLLKTLSYDSAEQAASLLREYLKKSSSKE